MKRDLTEFTQVVQHDTAYTIAATASVVKEKLAVSTTHASQRGLLWDPGGDPQFFPHKQKT